MKNREALLKYTQNMLEEDFRKSDEYILKLLFAHWILATFIVSLGFGNYIFGFFHGGLIFGVAYLFFKFDINRIFYRNVAAVALVSYSALFIQQHLGRLEFHFHIFVVLSFLTIYKDRMPMISASIFVIIHHILFNYLQEQGFSVFSQPIVIFNYGCGFDIVLLHAVFVIFEALVLYQIIGSKITEFKQVVESEYKMMNLNLILEEKIVLRTKELQNAKEEADRANGLKSQFLANMSHEIRTPMNAVIGFSEILRERESDELNKQYIISIQKSATSLLDIINDILDISKIEAGKFEIQKGVVNPYSFCSDIINIFKFKAKEKGVELILEVDNSISKALVFDEVRVRQILINLIGNALKFTSDGFVKLKLSKEPLSSDPSIMNLFFSVEDSGIGIKEESMSMIFESFVQQKSQSIKQYGGTGLGLAISKKLSALMNGDILVKSTVGKGSNFILVLNEVSVSSVLIEESDYRTTISEIAFERAKILVVDDIELNRELIRGFFLGNKEIVIDEASSGEEAIAKVKNSDYDLIVMDITMDGIDGLEASKIIKSLKNIPIIILTASLHKKETLDYISYYDSFLAKPTLKSTLLLEMAKYLKTNQEEQQLSSETQTIELSSNEKESMKLFVEEIRKCMQSGNMQCIDEALERFKNTHQNSSVIILDFLKKLKTAIEGFDLFYIEELIFEMNKNIDE